MSVLSDFEDWRENPEFQTTGPAFSDYTIFYVGISIVTVLALGIIALNFVLCCCSPYKQYWRDPNTGNRILFPVWIQTPHNQTPLTLQPELSQILIVDATNSATSMLFPLWPPVAVIALLMMLTIMIILIYGDKICARVRTHTDRIAVRVPRPSLEPMMSRMGSGERGPRQAPPPQAYHHQQPQQHQAYHEPPQRYSPQQHQQRYEAPMELQKQSTTYGHREIEV